jgi:hypothetical protein
MPFRSARRLPLAGLLAALALAWGCDSPTGSGPGVPASLDIVAGDLQRQTVGTELPQQLVVRVLNDKGKPVKGQIVNFRVTAGDGAVFAGTALTDASGEARERWTLGTVAGDTQRVEARAVNPATGEALVFGQFRAVGTPGPAASLVVVGSATPTGLPSLPLADSVAVFVRDVYGNPVPEQAVTWTVKQGGGTVSPASSATGANGVARTAWTLGPQFEGAQVLEAAAGLTITAQFTANVQLPQGAMLVKVSGDAQTGTVGQVLPQPLVIRVQRPDGTPLAGIPVTFYLAAQGGSINPSTGVSDATGLVTVNWTLGPTAMNLYGIAVLPTNNSVNFTAIARPGAAATLQKVSGDAQSGSVGAVLADSLTVRAVDAYGNAVPGVPVTWSAASGRVSPATSTSRWNGIARTAYWLPETAGPATVQASAPGVHTISFGVTALCTAVFFRVLEPSLNGAVGDLLRVRVRVDSARASVASVVATAHGRSVTLQPEPPEVTISAILELAGTPRGPTELRVVATTVNGDTSVIVVPFVHDGPPSVAVSAPVNNTVARPELRLDADCTDDDPAGCRSVSAWVYQTPPLAPVATGTTGIHTTVSLAQYEGERVFVEFRARDSYGQESVTSADTVYVESSTALAEVASAGTYLRDTDLNRVLFTDAMGALRLRSGGTETLIANRGGGRLHPQGVIYGSAAGLYDWRGGAPVYLGVATSFLRVEDSWAVWMNGLNLYRRDLAGGTTALVSSDVSNGYYDVTGSGVVAFSTTGRSADGYDVYLFNGNGTTRITADADASFWNVEPVTDGTNVLYLKSAQGGSSTLQAGHIALWRNGTETLLTSQPRRAFPRMDYDVNGGWIAYTNVDAGNILQVYTRAPDGTERRATSAGGNSELRALGADGTVVYANNGSVYAIRAPYTGTPVRIANDWGAYDNFRIVDGEVLLFLGRTVFRATF